MRSFVMISRLVKLITNLSHRQAILNHLISILKRSHTKRKNLNLKNKIVVRKDHRLNKLNRECMNLCF